MLLVDLLAQTVNVNLDRIRERIERFVPDVRGNLGPGNQLPGAPRQILEQSIFFRREFNFTGGARNSMTGHVKAQIFELQQIGMKLRLAPEQSPDPCEQLAEREGF